MNDLPFVINSNSIPILASMVLMMVSISMMLVYYFYIQKKKILVYFVADEGLLFLYSLFFLLMINSRSVFQVQIYARLLYTFLIYSVTGLVFIVDYITESSRWRFSQISVIISTLFVGAIWLDSHWFLQEEIVYHFYYTPGKGPLMYLVLAFSLMTGLFMIRRMLQYKRTISREAFLVIRPLLWAVVFFVFHSSFVGYTSVINPQIKPSNHVNIVFMTLMITLYFYNDIRHHMGLKDKLHEAYIKDSLTGVYSRDYIMNEIEKDIDLERQQHHYLAFLDMDSFKGINDMYGHLIGDKVLKRFGEILRTSMEEGVVVGRLGGDEFVLLFKNSNKKRVSTMLNNLTVHYMDLLKDMNVSLSGGRSISVGVVNMDFGKDLTLLMTLADRTMYEAKMSDRNNIVFYE